MKKVSCLLFMFMSFYFFGVAEDGYNGLVWGSSVAEVKAKYPGIEINRDVDCVSNEVFYEIEQGDVTRYFRFFEGGLYWVRVIYDYLSDTKLDSMSKKIQQVYGGVWVDLEELEPIDDPSYEFGAFLVDKNNLRRDIFITVEVKNKLNRYGNKLGEYVVVTYLSSAVDKKVSEAEVADFEL